LRELMDILAAAKRHAMFNPNDTVLVAVSGGPDSVAMLHALHARSAEFGITLHIAHLNHGIRGEESNLDEAFVRNLAHSFALPITAGRVDVPALRAEWRVGEEEAARIARSKFLQDTTTELGANKVAVGHTADDRAESVLLNIVRGCGVDGLGSIRPVNGSIVRPLIEATRADVERYIAENALPYRVDESNADTTYTRNRVRHELIPLLESEYNPEVRSALVRLAEIAVAQSDLIEGLAESALHEVALGNALDAMLFAKLPVAIQSQAIRSEILRLKGDLTDVSFEQIESVIEALHEGGDFTVNLPSGELFATRKGDSFRVWRRKAIAVVDPFDCVLQVPGTTEIPSIGLTLHCSTVEKPIASRLPADEAMIDAECVVGTLRVRSALPGDRIVPMGMAGSKKLQDVFVDKKVHSRERARSAVVVDDEKVLWVVGIVASELGKVTDRTGKAIHLTAERDQ
jgi:tRNA(Ile)-lysidine synthase